MELYKYFIRFQIFIILVCVVKTSLAQDPAYSQFYNAPLQLNPAFAGNSSSPAISIMYRSQWPTLEQAYNTYSISFDKFFDDQNSGVGITLLNDLAGASALRTTRAELIYSYRVNINSSTKAKGAINVSYSQRRLDWDRFIFYDAIDPLYGVNDANGLKGISKEVPPNNFQIGFLSVGAGFLLYKPKYFFGLNFDHINRPNNSFYKNTPNQANVGRDIKYGLHGGYRWKVAGQEKLEETHSYLQPNFMTVFQGGQYQINLGVLYETRGLIGGIAGRKTNTNLDAIIASFGLRVGPYKFTYSYDANLGKVAFKHIGSHELGVLIKFGNESSKPDINDCLQIFR